MTQFNWMKLITKMPRVGIGCGLAARGHGLHFGRLKRPPEGGKIMANGRHGCWLFLMFNIGSGCGMVGVMVGVIRP